MKTLFISLICLIFARLFFRTNNFDFLEIISPKINQEDIDDAMLRTNYLER
jgi:hypothetical protein